MKTACVIPARGGSVRIPGKNIKLFHGRPIIEYSIETAKRSGLFDDIVVSTDSIAIGIIARRAGASIHWRNPDDGSKGTQQVAADVLGGRNVYGLACVLYATAPMLTCRDLVSGWQAMHKPGVMYAFSVNAHDDRDIGGFYWGVASAFVEGLPLARPQEELALYRRYRHTEPVPIPSERAIDINTPEDWYRAEQMYSDLELRRDCEALERGELTQGEFLARNDL